MTPAQLSIAFFLQVALILMACRVVGGLARRWLGQPRVVGEMIAGVLLGPSLFGAVAPEIQSFLFPPESKALLFVIAQFGVGLYMFLVGLGFDRAEFRASVRGAAFVSFAGMAAPFLAAAALAPWMIDMGGLFAPQVTRTEASLFLGAAIAITAFPMLARIIHERGLSGSTLGTLSLSAGAIGDAGAWAVIALVLASFGGGAHLAWLAIGGGSAFALVMIFIAPRLLAGLEGKLEAWGEETVLGIVLVLYLLSGWAMDFVGIHAVFGGFLLGTAMPRGTLSQMVKERLEPVAVVLFLPFFFTYSGLHTQLSILADPTLLQVSLAVLAVSILSKGGASYLAARLSGQDNASSLAIGALMNARGLMELIVINIGLQRGIIGAELFSILVLMAIVTTLMASPLFEMVYGRAARKDGRL
ncbi:MAG: cation:proton antiporter [Novosphingobium sp.]